jgi:hypothetical protein
VDEGAAVTDPMETLRRLERNLEFALRAEGVPAAARDRIVSRVIYGEPGAPSRIRRYRSLYYGKAAEFLGAWFEGCKAVTSGAPEPYKTPPPCPGCGGPATILTVAAASPGFFEVRPCGCLFDVPPILGPDSPTPYLPKETTYGTPVSPPTFLPIADPEPPLPPGLSHETFEQMMAQVPEEWRDA